MMRLLTWVWACVLIGASLLVADLAARPALVTALLVSSVPMLVFILASTNPSGWTVAGTAACFFAAIAGLRSRSTTPPMGRRSDRSAGRAHRSLGAAGQRPVGWRGDGHGDAGPRPGAPRRDPKAPVPATIGATLRALPPPLHVVDGHLPRADSALGSAPDRPVPDVVFSNLSEVPYLWTGSLGTSALGWFDTPMPALVPAAMVGVWAAAGAIGLGHPEPDEPAGAGASSPVCHRDPALPAGRRRQRRRGRRPARATCCRSCRCSSPSALLRRIGSPPCDSLARNSP